MGNGMNKILPGLYLGNFRDSRDTVQLTKNNITHIVSIHDNAKPMHMDKQYLCITASDSADQDLAQYFSECNRFIHRARLNGGSVLVHCLAGISRSVTITVAYIMAVTDLGWRKALNVVRASRSIASPNFGFQRQLHEYEFDRVEEERAKMKEEFGTSPFDDQEECERVLKEVAEQAAKSAATDQPITAAAGTHRQITAFDGIDGSITAARLSTATTELNPCNVTSTNCTTSSCAKTDCTTMWSALEEDLGLRSSRDSPVQTDESEKSKSGSLMNKNAVISTKNDSAVSNQGGSMINDDTGLGSVSTNSDRVSNNFVDGRNSAEDKLEKSPEK